MPLSRRDFLCSAAAFSLLSAFVGCAQPRKLTIASYVWPGYESLYLARHERWLDPNKVELLNTHSARETLRAIEEGRADAGTLTLDEMLRARSHGVPLVAVLVFDISAGADAIYARSGIRSVADLRGRRVAYEEGSTGALVLARALDIAGLEQNDVVRVPLSVHEHLSAWQQENIDALVCYEPIISLLAAFDAHRLFDTRQMPDMVVDVLAIHQKVLDAGNQNAALRHVIHAHFKALRHITTNPHDAFARMAERLGLSIEQVPGAFRGLVMPDWQNNRDLLAGSQGHPPELLVGAQQLGALMVKLGLLNIHPDLDGVLNGRFLPEEAPR